MKRKIRLTEGDRHRIVREAIKRTLKENMYTDMDGEEWEEDDIELEFSYIFEHFGMDDNRSEHIKMLKLLKNMIGDEGINYIRKAADEEITLVGQRERELIKTYNSLPIN